MRPVFAIMPLVLPWAIPNMANGQTAAEANPAQALADMDRMAEELQKLGDWDQQVPLVTQAVEDLWARNQWNSEADLFARKLATEVARVPPWQIDRRLETCAELVGERYELSGPAASRFKRTLYRESLGMLWNNAALLAQQTSEMVGMRLRGEPFTPQRVAEWTRQNEPLMRDMRQRADSLAKELGEIIDQRHRDQFERDLASMNKRMEHLERQREQWAAGKWKPDDWGLANDPIHRALSERSTTQPAAEPGPDTDGGEAGRTLPYDPSTWHWHLRAFVQRYHLDAGQVTAAESIHAELVERAAGYLRTRADLLVEVPLQQRRTDAGFAPVRQMFGEFETRLDRIPTRGQRQAVGAEPISLQ